MKTIGLAMVCVAMLLASADSTRADIIVNGSFETPIVPVGSFTDFVAGSTDITGWTVVGVDAAVVNESFTQSGITFQAQDGNQWLDLAGVTSNSMLSGVSQDVTTEIGRAYILSFYVGSATDNVFFFPSTVDLSINGGARVSYTNPAAPTDRLDWKLFTAKFTATTANTNITFYNGGAPQQLPERHRQRVTHGGARALLSRPGRSGPLRVGQSPNAAAADRLASRWSGPRHTRRYLSS